jgi:hypothetical protein
MPARADRHDPGSTGGRERVVQTTGEGEVTEMVIVRDLAIDRYWWITLRYWIVRSKPVVALMGGAHGRTGCEMAEVLLFHHDDANAAALLSRLVLDFLGTR